MKITLVCLYNVYSYAIRILHAVLKEAGYDVSSIYFYDFYTNEYPSADDIKELIRVLKEEKPDLIGFTILSPFFPLFKRLSVLIREELNSFLLVGGHHANVSPEDCLRYADAICMGDGEEAILDFLKTFPKPVPGIIFDKPYKINRQLITDLDSIPFRAFLEDGSQKYIKCAPKYESTQSMNVLTSRGCHFNCSFCYNHVMRRLTQHLDMPYYRRRSVDNVIAEILELRGLFPDLKELVFSDNVFSGDIVTISKTWIDEFCEKYKPIDLPFRCFGHFAGITKDTLDKLKGAGCTMITMGFQSGSERVRKRYLNKLETNEQIIEATRLIAESGIVGRYDRIREIPYETTLDRKETDYLIAKLHRPFQLREFVLLNHPSTALTTRLLRDGHITPAQVEGVCATAYKQTVKITRYTT